AGSLGIGAGRRLMFRLRATEQHQDGVLHRQLGLHLATGLGRLRLANQLDLDLSQSRPGAGSTTARELAGTLRWSGLWGRLRVRGSAAYQLLPRHTLRELSAVVERQWTPGLRGRVQLDHSLGRDRLSRLSAEVDRRFTGFVLGLSGQISEHGESSLGLTLSLGLAREPDTGRWFGRPDALAAGGVVTARVFVDRDRDGRLSDGDQPIRGARVEGGGSSAESDASGQARLYGLPAQGTVVLRIDEASLQDPSWRPQRPAVALGSRAGRVAAVDFPVLEASELEGTVWLEQGDDRQPVAKARVQLLDVRSNVIRETRSAFDGFYLFTALPPGRYTVRLDPRQMRDLKLDAVAPVAIRLDPGKIAVADDLRLTLAGSQPQLRAQRAW
ncbi:MAG: carboxypeptidase-like regulatory domain-containing protein, partial [Holophagales bacterium]|nr:carboxypeptidase-like regulatory domain-containing protein [Holophagales bacterium]